MKHKHAEVIKAWDDGAVIECRDGSSEWQEIKDAPCWWEDLEYRVKPETVPESAVSQQK